MIPQSIEEIKNVLIEILELQERLELILSEPTAISLRQRIKLGGLLARYMWINGNCTVNELYEIRQELNDMIIDCSK